MSTPNLETSISSCQDLIYKHEITTKTEFESSDVFREGYWAMAPPLANYCRFMCWRVVAQGWQPKE